jgi:hypothetical protein
MKVTTGFPKLSSPDFLSGWVFIALIIIIRFLCLIIHDDRSCVKEEARKIKQEERATC